MSMTIFATEINRLAARFPRNVAAMQRDVALNVVDHVANSTPVDTGQASGNWKTAIDSASNGWDPGPSSPNHSYQAAVSALSALTMGRDVHITNNVPYIALLNAGYSNQAPNLFVETAIVSAIAQLGNYDLLVT